MDESRFHVLADAIMEKIVETLDEAGEWCDVELHDGVLTIIVSGGKQYLINKHATMRQIWLASPFSGAAHFAHDDASDDWVSTRQKDVTLCGLLAAEISGKTGHSISF